jgi:hypothetical protein
MVKFKLHQFETSCKKGYPIRGTIILPTSVGVPIVNMRPKPFGPGQEPNQADMDTLSKYLYERTDVVLAIIDRCMPRLMKAEGMDDVEVEVRFSTFTREGLVVNQPPKFNLEDWSVSIDISTLLVPTS